MRETIRKWIEECIREETARTGAPNRWGRPLVGFADASDEAHPEPGLLGRRPIPNTGWPLRSCPAPLWR